MFRKSGYSIAMGQASDEVKQAVTWVTAGMDDKGFAKAVEAYILGERPRSSDGPVLAPDSSRA
jgi:hydroxymethylpyrimidine pyrophosphatase-like HAD family hydrolase